MDRFFSAAYVSIALGLVTGLATGCSASSAPAHEDRQVIEGKLDGQGGSSTKTTDYVALSGNGGAHVIAHQLGPKGSDPRSVTAAVGTDGSFHLELDRGARYVLEIEQGGKHVAVVGFKSKASGKDVDVLPIASSTSGKAAVNVGRVHVAASGGGAAVEVSPLDSIDERDATGLPAAGDVWFVRADGALQSADEALREAEAALADAERALADAQKALEDANDATKKAQDAANAAAGKK